MSKSYEPHDETQKPNANKQNKKICINLADIKLAKNKTEEKNKEYVIVTMILETF